MTQTEIYALKYEKNFLTVLPQVSFIAYLYGFADVQSDSQTAGLMSTAGTVKVVPVHNQGPRHK